MTGNPYIPNWKTYDANQIDDLYSQLDAANARITCVVKNCVNLDDTTPRDEPGPLCGPTWAKVAHVCGLGSTSAHELCRKVGVDPNYDCREDIGEL